MFVFDHAYAFSVFFCIKFRMILIICN